MDSEDWAAQQSPELSGVPTAELRLQTAAILLFAFSTEAIAQSRCRPQAVRAYVGDSVELVAANGASHKLLELAIGHWRKCGESFGRDFPGFVTDGSGGRKISVEVTSEPGSNFSCGSFQGNRIVLHPKAHDPAGRLLHCGALDLNLAHELGHVLGLSDQLDRKFCRHSIMSKLIAGSNAHNRRVYPEECDVAGRIWLTPAERTRAIELGLITPNGDHPPLVELLLLLEPSRPPVELRPQVRRVGGPVDPPSPI